MTVKEEKRQKKSILIVATVSGFLPQFIMNHVTILQQLGYEVHYASNFKTPHYGKDNQRLKDTNIILHQIDFVRSPYQLFSNLRAYHQLKKIIKQHSFSFIHCHTPMGGCLTRLAVKKKDRKQKKCFILYTAHGFHFYKGAPLKNWLLYYPMEYFLAYRTDFLITITKEDYKRAKKFRGITPNHIYYVPGVGISSFDRIKKSKEEIRKLFGWRKEELIFISVGELNKNKNQRAVITALSQLKESKIKYILCGEGDCFLQLKEFVYQHSMESKVEFLGYREDIEEILNAADVFVLPSYREGLSIALQEAMKSGLPIIATKIRGNRELVQEKKGGWLVPVDDLEALKSALKEAIYFFKVNKEKLKQMGAYNQKRIKANSVSIVNKKIEKIYKTIEKEQVF